MKKKVIRRKAATLALRDLLQKKKNFTGQEVNKHCALYGIHALMTSNVFEVRYFRSSAAS